MKQFAKAALAVFVGVMVYDACNDALHAVIRRSKRKKKKEKEQIKYESYYSPNKSRTIGFKMKGEE